ncbi:MAG: signal recognition particle-docking protein FtsY [Thermoprotei archaeon]|nr:MAG: signal recognition particle-docking protein FtsY [Thermoprotei archaeon]
MFNKLRNAVKGLIDKLTTVELNEKTLNEYLDELFFKLVESDVAVEVAEHIIHELSNSLRGKRVPKDKNLIRNTIRETMYNVLISLFPRETPDLVTLIKEKRERDKAPFVILFLGPNGHGKTTTLAKIAFLLKREGFKVVLACSDTFRAGAEEQLAEHARRLSVRMIKHKYGADPAAVAYDAVRFAENHNYDVVLIDTAGRLQTDRNLMEELKKIARVVKPDLKIFVGDALMGNDVVEQISTFDKEIGIDAVILTKVDADVKGGAAISIAKTTGRPIIYLGTGQEYDDLMKFNPEDFVKKIIGL